MYKQRYQTNIKSEWLDLLATKIAELKLSELGYNFIPGITPLFTRAKKFIEAKALIVRSGTSIIDEENSERKTV